MKLYVIYSIEDGNICKVTDLKEAKETILEFEEIDLQDGIEKKYYIRVEKNGGKNDKKRES